MIEDSLEGGNTAVVHIWRCERDVPERGCPEFTHILTTPAMPLHASVGFRVGTASVLVIEAVVVELCLRCAGSVVDQRG